jgi:hypothetical protein
MTSRLLVRTVYLTMFTALVTAGCANPAPPAEEPRSSTTATTGAVAQVPRAPVPPPPEHRYDGARPLPRRKARYGA